MVAPSEPTTAVTARTSDTWSDELAITPRRASLAAERSDYLLAFGISAFIASVLVVAEPDLRDPMVIPVVLSGALGGVDAVRALRRRLEWLDPQALFGCFAWHFFFLAPLLHVTLDYYLSYVPTPDDFRPWLEQMAWWNVAGLVTLRVVFHVWDRFVPLNPVARHWDGAGRHFRRVLWGFIALSAVFEVWVLVTTGWGLIDDPTQTEKRFEGLGWQVAIANSLPLLVLFAVIFLLRDRGKRPSMLMIVGMLTAFTGAQLAVAGLRGSRATVIFGVVIAATAVHFLLRRLSGRFLVTSVLIGVLFMYVYGFYKSFGTEGLDDVITRGREQATLEERSGRNIQLVLLGDLGRSDVQALLLERLDGRAGEQYRFRYGETYLGDVASVIPRALIPNRPAGKRPPGTELLYGSDLLESGYLAQNIYGLAGEWTLNFGPTTIPIAFALFGCAASFAFRFCRTLPRGDTRTALIGLAGILAILGMSSDLDNVLWAAVAFGLVPLVALFVGSSRRIASPR